MHLAQELLMKVQCSSGSRSFAKETMALKMRSVVAGHRKLTTNKRKRHQSWSSYNYTRSCWRTQHWPFCSCSALEAHWKAEKTWEVGVLWADPKILKNGCFEVPSSFIPRNNNELFLDWTVIKSGFYRQPVMTSSVVGLRRNSKALPKAKLAPKTAHGHCLVVCYLSDPLQLSESQQNHYIWELRSANRCCCCC